MQKLRLVFSVALVTVLAIPLGVWTLDAQEQQNEEQRGTAGRVREVPRNEREDEMMPFKGTKVAVLTGEGFQDAEAMMPMAYLANRGAEITVIGTETGLVKAYNSDIEICIQKAVGDVSAGDFDVLVLPGGKAPDEIRKDEAVLEFTREFWKLGRPVAAICHGPQVLVTAGVIEGKEMTAVSGIADELREAGAEYKDEPVVRDGHLITSRVPKDIPVWLSTIEKVMKEKAER
jgi:protease I